MNALILAIEATGESGGAAVVRDGKVLAEALVSGPRTHGAELHPKIAQAVEDAGVARADLDIIAVNCGPGSYTGLRIGLSAAAAIGYALDRPVVGVACFDAMVLQFCAGSEFDSDATEVWPVLDARRGEVMTARFCIKKGVPLRDQEDRLLTAEALCKEAQEGAIVFGTGLPPYKDRFDAARLKLLAPGFGLLPSSVGLQAVLQLAGLAGPEDIKRDRVEPRYFRRVLAKTTKERAAGA